MDFELSEEQRLLRDSVERLTTQRYDFEARKKYMKETDGGSRALWKQYVDLGLTALPFAEGVPEDVPRTRSGAIPSQGRGPRRRAWFRALRGSSPRSG